MFSFRKPSIGFRLAVCSIIFISGACFQLKARLITMNAGPAFEHNYYGQPGLFIDASSEMVLGGHPHIRLHYSTSRLSFWHGEYDLSVDDYYLSALWNFRPGKMFDPHAGLDLGMTHFDDDLLPGLDNNSLRLNLRAGMVFSFLNGRVKPFIDGGYAVLTSSTTFLFFYTCGVGYEIPLGGN